MDNHLTSLKVVVIGGGSGSSVVLQGLKRHTRDLAAVVTMFDTGGSTGLLRKDFGYPALGDLRQCLLGLSEDTDATKSLRDIIGFRFSHESSVNGHSLGNLLLAALTTLGKDLERAIDEMARFLGVTGKVLPVTLERADLCARLADGCVIRGESNIDLRGQPLPKIQQVFLDPVVLANNKAIQAILAADIVILGPGDLYTSIIPNLLVDGINEALMATKATRVYVCNLMSKLGETDGFQASDFVGEIVRYLGGVPLDWVLLDTGPVSRAVQEAYLKESAHPVELDLDAVRNYVPGVFATRLSNNQVPLKHEPARVAEAVLSIANLGRCREMLISANGHQAEAPGAAVVSHIGQDE